MRQLVATSLLDQQPDREIVAMTRIKSDESQLVYFAAVICELIEEVDECLKSNCPLSKRLVRLYETMPDMLHVKYMIEQSLRGKY